MRILIASTNTHKCAELANVGRRFGIKLVTPQTLAVERSLGAVPKVDENGTTFEENARIKALAFREWSDMDTLGDDSGLEVEALGGRPGVFSARYGGGSLNDRQRCALLLDEIRALEYKSGIINRRAQFVCSLAFYPVNGSCITYSHALAGTIIDEPRGTNGFGYDPIVLIDEIQQTLAEVDFEVTCTRGFRARAAEKLFAMVLGEQR
jgi:XTP/dITP diphosphohydrolase